MIYTNIVKKAKDNNLSISLIEKKADLSTGSVCKWNLVSPTARSLKKVADILKCTVDELLREEEGA